ncbi:hypothetical protein LEP1GSC058_0614 [Leptospira fainei serovar Hurstbridge str. BUT 6]|uniref:Uncharacterized protein n=1 Tax=Leptospira fainei serovar Hurstbridge str. BUT 6 TaxID=1193011 RepID=S3VH12_9LEPT|nr:hypothetical protein LEP1GSC058_0614 [Leptospira fainei serovar Hurstbridge str. BUT 6]
MRNIWICEIRQFHRFAPAPAQQGWGFSPKTCVHQQNSKAKGILTFINNYQSSGTENRISGRGFGGNLVL